MHNAALAPDPLLASDPFSFNLLSLLAGAPLTSPATSDVAAAGDNYTPHQFEIPAGLGLGIGGAKKKALANLEAIRIIKAVSTEARSATEKEKCILAGYVGWGGLPQAFRRPDGSVATGWETIVQTMEDLLTVDELESARHSTTDAHYTPRVVIEAIYAGLTRLGWKGGKVLEPAAGIGNFIGLNPSDVREATRWTAIELDQLSASICRALYPSATTIQAALQDVCVPRDHFDLAIGNPPFGANTLYDRDHKDLGDFTLHNYFFAKSLRSVVPGGLLAMVVSRTLMDKASGKERTWLAERAHLLGAIRLPSSTFKANAGTEVTTDILFLQRKRGEDNVSGVSWTDVVDHTDPTGGQPISINRYFADHPEQMLGRMAWVSGAYGHELALVEHPGSDLASDLAEAIARLPMGIDLPKPNIDDESSAYVQPPHGTPIFGHYLASDGSVWQRRPDVLGQCRAQRIEMKGRDLERFRALIELRLDLRALIESEQDPRATDASLAMRRQRVNACYDFFVSRFGFLNSSTNVRAFRDDADAFMVRALEANYQRLDTAEAKRAGVRVPKGRSTVERAEKAPILYRRVMHPSVVTKPSTPQDALAASLNMRGGVNAEFMGQLLGMPPDDVMAALGDLVYRTPEGQWETADAYLSGNVKAKLSQARDSLSRDPSLTRNIFALEGVQPPDVVATDIYVCLGSPWVPATDYAQFASEVLGMNGVDIKYVQGAQTFIVNGGGKGHVRFATPDMNASTIFHKVLCRTGVTVYKRLEDDTYVVDRDASEAARQQGEQMQSEFTEWVWKDLDRRERLVRIYNDTFNTDAPRKFDGSHLTFPGKVSDDVVALRKHQIDAAWRMITTGVALLHHEVGAGKTITTIAALMEMRRIGLIHKPLVTVPNALVDQWAQEVNRLYPAANVLAVTEGDFNADRRKLMFARIATGDWDMIIIAHSQFTRISVPHEFRVSYLKGRISEMLNTIFQASDSSNGRLIKRLEKTRDSLKERLKALLDGSRQDDRTASMADMGIDCIVCDESHAFKNLSFSTSKRNVSGLGNPTGSQRAEDLFLKVRYLQQMKAHAATYFLTATPIANSLVELFTVQRYLGSDELDERGLTGFDLWSNTFAEESVSFEIDSSGQGLKARTVLKRFLNIPELMAMYRRYADTVSLADLKRIHLDSTGTPWPVPAIAGGRPENIIVPPSSALSAYIQKCIIPRMIHVSGEKGNRPDPRSDNMLKITNDARLAALDVRLRCPASKDDPCSKVNEAVRRVYTIWQAWSKQRGTQLVFCDLSTPTSALGRERAKHASLVAAADAGDEASQRVIDSMSPDEIMALEGGFSVYDDMRAKLISHGVPAHEIAFIHDAHTDQQRRALFDKVNRGEVRILIGSTSKMGTGMNVQRRLVALHHLDTPWRPADLIQREGRIIRQGNLFYEDNPSGFEVQILRYATSKTYDARMWELIQRKASIVDQLFDAGDGQREVDDIASQAATAAEMKAAATGDPRMVEQVELQATVKRLNVLKRSHQQHLYEAERKLSWLEQGGGPNARLAAQLKRIDSVEAQLVAFPREPFTVIVDGMEHSGAKEASFALADRVAQLINRRTKGSYLDASVGLYRGFEILIDFESPTVTLDIRHDSDHIVNVAVPINANGQLGATSLLNRLDNALATIDDWRPAAFKRYERDVRDIAEYRNFLTQPFRFTDELVAAEHRLRIVTDELIRAGDRTAVADNTQASNDQNIARDIHEDGPYLTEAA